MEDWRGCQLSTRNADYWHAADDFASQTYCEIPLTSTGAPLTEDYSNGKTICPRCRAALSERTR